MVEVIHHEIPLLDLGIEGAGFRIQNTPDELQRVHIDQYKTSDIKYQADIVAIVHGTITPGGPLGVLLVVDFKFLSNPQRCRFKRVEISIAFGRENNAIGGRDEPIVKDLAPCGTFRMDEATQTKTDTLESDVSLQGGCSLATLSVGGSFQRTTTMDIKSHAILNAQWEVMENRTLRVGVPAHLRTAILLELPDEAKFRAELQLIADIGTFRQKIKRKVGAHTKLDPVNFDPSETMRFDFGPTLQDVDKTNLGACCINVIGSANSAASI
ncbi:hypothetical protein H0G86_009950 [Trichoderma simmonsii]|uniref:Uncharacterized protein n=1 Tax=Trichoderma simmonsii TaxID=1491479 RepID=A0A8G0LNT2_9HYPO|nr:hypothetical protein H0G86_009950 [Trichoderma simmonsii]